MISNALSRHIETRLTLTQAADAGPFSFNDGIVNRLAQIDSDPATGGALSLLVGDAILSSVTTLAPAATWTNLRRADIAAITIATSGGTGVPYWVASSGQHTVTAIVDPLGAIAESDKTNNSKAAIINVGQPQQQLPDVVVTALDFAPKDAQGNAVIGAEITWQATIQNTGIGPTPQGTPPYPDGGLGNHRLTFYVDGALQNWEDTFNGPLQPGQSQSVFSTGGPAGKATWTAAGTVGAHTVEARFDEAQLIQESNETNNNRILNIALANPVGGGPGGGPSSRDAGLWPGAATDPFNMPLGDGFGTQQVDPAIGQGYVGAAGWVWNTINPFGHIVKPAEGSHTDLPNGTAGEGHVSVRGAAQGHINDMTWIRDYGNYYNPTATTWRWIDCDLKGSLINYPGGRLTGGYTGFQKVCVGGYANLAGNVRRSDLVQGFIPHALNFVLNQGRLKRVNAGVTNGTGGIWPANGEDGPQAAYGGNVYIGSLLFIPMGIVRPAGLSAIGVMFWDALQKYGGYVSDTTATNPSLVIVDINCADFAGFTTWTSSGEFANTIVPNLRRRSDNSQANPGGPGNRLAPLAPAV